MLAVPYFEKRLYELPEVEVTPERIIALADEVCVTCVACDSRYRSYVRT
jgi:hypothetical protein